MLLPAGMPLALAQTLHCYTPADLRLLLEGSGLRLECVLIDGVNIDLSTGHQALNTGWFKNEYNYLVRLVCGAEG